MAKQFGGFLQQRLRTLIRQGNATSALRSERIQHYDLQRFWSIPSICGGLVIGIGCLVLLGWQLNIEVFKVGFFMQSASMKANAAICFILSGLSLQLLQTNQRKDRHYARALAVVVGVIALVTLLQFATRLDFGIDQLIYRETAPASGVVFPGRMAVNTAFNFVLISSGLLFLCRKQEQAIWTAQILALLAALVTINALLGFFYGVTILYQPIAEAASMAFHTGLAFGCLSLGILFTHPSRAIMQTLTAPTHSSLIGRRLILMATLFPLITGWLILQGEEAGFYDTAFALSLLVLLIIVMSAIVIWQTTNSLNRAQYRLEESEGRLRSFIESNVIGILFGNVDGKIYDANDEFLRLIGYSREDLEMGRLSWIHLTPSEYLPDDFKHVAEAQRRGACTPYEKEYLCKDGTRIPVLVGYTLVGEAQRETIAFILDLSARKQLETQLTQQAEALARANRLKDEFLAIVSHELRTPLNPILGWAKLLQSRDQNETTIKRALEAIERNAKTQAQLVEDLLDVSCMVRGEIHLESAPVDLLEVTKAAIETMQVAADAKDITIKLEEPYQTPDDGSHLSMPLIVNGDAKRLQQVIWNLLSNAVKFTPIGGRVEVKLSWVTRPGSWVEKQRTNYAQITVTDTGRGIPPELLAQIFAPFRQGDSGTTRSFGGLGLGLAIVHYLVELHGGVVTASSLGVNQGSAFTVKLPIIKKMRLNPT